MIAVLGASGTIARQVVGFLEEWGVEVARRDYLLEGQERVDARDTVSLVRAHDGAEVCVNCAHYRLSLEVMRGCLAAGAHYIDLGGLFHMTRRQLELDDAFREAGLTAILGLGSAPGKTNLLARAAVERLDAPPVALEIWAASRDPAAAGHPFPAPYSVQTLPDELRLQLMVVADGELREREPLSAAAERVFPEPIGPATGIYTLHSELATLPLTYPTLREASFRLSLAPGLVEKLLALGEAELPEPYTQSVDAVAVQLVEASAADGRSVNGLTLTRGGSARSTAEPAARGAVELGEGRLGAHGAAAPESAVPDPEGFLALLDTEVRWHRA